MKRGYIRERGKGKFSITIELPKDTISNKRKRKYYTFNGTRREAEKFLTEKLRELDTGVLIDNKKIKFSEYLDFWIEEYCVKNLSITTLDGYKQNIEKHIKPILGNIYLDKLTPLHLQNFYSDRLKNGKLNGNGGLSNKTVLTLHRIIHKALEQGVKWQLVIRNVADAVEPPKPKKYKANFLDEQEINILIQKSKNTNLYIPILIAICTGMRRGEVLGLTWNNVDLEKNSIMISQTLYSTSKGLVFSTPKTDSSVRKIAIPQALSKELKKHKTRQLKNKIKYGEEYKNINIVCTSDKGELINPKSFSRDFRKLLKNNNLPLIRFHDLRHTHASLLVKMGTQPKEISNRLGHSNISITMDLYSHIYEATDNEVAKAFNNILRITS